MNNNLKFILKTTWLHIVTYILCGIIFSSIFNYHNLFAIDGVDKFMREFEGLSTLLGPLVQIIRGVLFGLVLLLFKDTFINKKYGWLRLWIILGIIGIINTPAPAPFSIEGLVYTKLPLEFHLKGAPEVLIQTLLFSYLLTKPKRNRNIKFIKNNKNEFIIAIVCMVLFSLSGILLSLIKGIDIVASTSDVRAFGVMFIAVISTFFISKFYPKIKSKFKDILVLATLYFLLAILPYIYNLLTKSPFNTNLTLLINIVPTAVVLLLIKSNCKNNKKII